MSSVTWAQTEALSAAAKETADAEAIDELRYLIPTATTPPPRPAPVPHDAASNKSPEAKTDTTKETAQRRASGVWWRASRVLLVEFSERLVLFSLGANLVLFFITQLVRCLFIDDLILRSIEYLYSYYNVLHATLRSSPSLHVFSSHVELGVAYSPSTPPPSSGYRSCSR